METCTLHACLGNKDSKSVVCFRDMLEVAREGKSESEDNSLMKIQINAKKSTHTFFNNKWEMRFFSSVRLESVSKVHQIQITV